MAEQPAQYFTSQRSVEMQNLANMYQLGAPLAEYRAGFTRRTIGRIIVSVILTSLFGFDVIDAASRGTSGAALIPAIFTLLVLAGLVWNIIYSLQSRSWCVYVFNQGFVFLKDGQPDIFRWEEVQVIWQQIKQYYYYGFRISKTHKYIIECVDGHRVVFNDRFKNVEELGNGLSQQISEFMLPKILEDYNAGNVVTFGPLSVSQQGINNGEELLPWSSIQEIEASQGPVSVIRASQDIVKVRKEGKRRNWSTVPVAKIPNFFVFLALTKHILGR